MSTQTSHPTDDDEAHALSSSDRRVWKRWNPSQGSSELSLKAMAVLYDAGQPLSRDDLADRLFPQLDVYARSYLEAWWQRQRDLGREKIKRHRNVTVGNAHRTVTSDPQRALRAWITAVFGQRARSNKGSSLIRDPDGRYRPGLRPPQAMRIDGTIVDFTPAMRQELEHREHDQGRVHLALLEWDRLIEKLDLTTPQARIQLLMVLLRRMLLSATKQTVHWPFNERTLGLELRDLLRLADTKGVQRAILQRALDALWPEAT